MTDRKSVSLTTEQKEARLKSIGGSDAAPSVGLSPWKTQYELWAEKTGTVTPDDISDLDAVWWGSQLERLIGVRAEEKYGLTVRRSNVQFKHETNTWMHANIDGRVQGRKQGVEIKTASSRFLDDWGDEDTDQVPLNYLLQCVHYQVVTGLTSLPWIILLLVDGRTLRKYEVPFDADLAEMLVAKEREFWTLVETKQEPEIKTVADMSLAWAQDNGKFVVADDEMISVHRNLTAVRENLKTIGAEKDELEIRIKQYMRDNADMLITSDGNPLVTWRTSKSGSKLDTARFKAEHPDIHKQFLIERPGSRRFLVKEART